jgi:uncharacterized membrane protein YwaF
MLTNFALWTILITNLSVLLIPIIMLVNLNFTPGKELLEISAIIVTILIIYLINLEAEIITNKIRFIRNNQEIKNN